MVAVRVGLVFFVLFRWEGCVCIELYNFVEAFPEGRWFWVVPSS